MTTSKGLSPQASKPKTAAKTAKKKTVEKAAVTTSHSSTKKAAPNTPSKSTAKRRPRAKSTPKTTEPLPLKPKSAAKSGRANRKTPTEAKPPSGAVSKPAKSGRKWHPTANSTPGTVVPTSSKNETVVRVFRNKNRWNAHTAVVQKDEETYEAVPLTGLTAPFPLYRLPKPEYGTARETRKKTMTKVPIVLNKRVKQKLLDLERVYVTSRNNLVVGILGTLFVDKKWAQEFLYFFQAHQYPGSKKDTVYIWITKEIDESMAAFCAKHINEPLHRSTIVRVAIMYVSHLCGI